MRCEYSVLDLPVKALLLVCSYDKAEKAKLQAKKKAALERLEKGEAVGSDGEEEDDDKIDETEEAGKQNTST